MAPGHAGSARLDDVAEPPLEDGPLLVDTIAIGVCGTDVEIVAASYGTAPPGSDRLILGHESLGRVREAPDGSGFAPGDLVVGIVRRPDPVPCSSCAIGEWDMCRNGQFTERGIKGRNGYASDRFRIDPQFAVKVDAGLGELGVLVEPASVLAKAWDHITRIGNRAHWEPHRVVVTGAGPIGLLAALMGRQRGLDVVVFDHVTTGPKPALVADLGATYRSDGLDEVASTADVLIECTGVSTLVLDVLGRTAADGIVCLTGVSTGGRAVEIDAGMVNRSMVLGNDVVFGSVNANRRHYEAGADALARADREWLARLITRHVPADRFADALTRHADDVKPIIQFAAA